MLTRKLVIALTIIQTCLLQQVEASSSTDADLPPLPTFQEEEKPTNQSIKKDEIKPDINNEQDDKDIESQLKALDNKFSDSDELKQAPQNDSKEPKPPAAELAKPDLPALPDTEVAKPESQSVKQVKPQAPIEPTVELKTPTSSQPTNTPVLEPELEVVQPSAPSVKLPSNEAALEAPIQAKTENPKALDSSRSANLPPPPPFSPESIQSHQKVEGAGQKVVDSPAPIIEDSKFVSDEAKVLLLPSDEVVLGVLTKEAEIDNLDFFKYVSLYRKEVQRLRTTVESEEINNFIASYEQKFHTTDEFKKNAKDEVFYLVDKGNIQGLKAIIDRYPVLQVTDEEGSNLLLHAVKNEDYLMVKYLLLRGVNLNKPNYRAETAFILAQVESNSQIENLLKKASKNY